MEAGVPHMAPCGATIISAAKDLCRCGSRRYLWRNLNSNGGSNVWSLAEPLGDKGVCGQSIGYALGGRRSMLRIPWRRHRLRPYEEAVVASLEPVVSPSTWAAVREHIAAVSFVQRHTRGKEVNLYYSDRLMCKCIAPSPFDAWPIAITRYHVQNEPTTIRASVWIAGGRLFSILFSHSPSPYRTGELSVLSTDILFDPLAFPLRGSLDLVLNGNDLSHAPRYIREMAASFGPDAQSRPLVAEVRERFLLPARDCLPNDFMNILGYTNGFGINGWHCAGLPIQEVAMEEANLFVLASASEPVVLCAVDGDKTRRVYFYDLERDKGRRLGDSFLAALESS